LKYSLRSHSTFKFQMWIGILFDFQVWNFNEDCITVSIWIEASLHSQRWIGPHSIFTCMGCSKRAHSRPILFVGSVYCFGMNLFRSFQLMHCFQVLRILSLSLVNLHLSDLYVTNP
jgi:hypothetical protein